MDDRTSDAIYCKAESMKRENNIIISAIIFSIAFAVYPMISMPFVIPKLYCLYFGVAWLLLSWFYAAENKMLLPLARRISIAALALCLWLLMSTTFALDVPLALFGYYNWYTGLLFHLACICLFIMAATLQIDKEAVLRSFIYAMTVLAIFAIWQHCSDIPGGHSYSLSGNKTSAAAVMSMSIPFAVYFSIRRSLKWSAVIPVIILGIIFCGERGPMLGLIASMIIIIVMMGKSRGRRFACYGLCFIFLALLFCPLRKDIMSLTTMIERLHFWNAAIHIIKDHPLLGVGPENFRLAYPDYTSIVNNIVPTKVHDGYLQYAVCSGVPALICYLALIFFVLQETYKKNELLSVTFIAVVIGYLVQDLVGFEEVSLTPYFWIIIGLAINRTEIFGTKKEGRN